MQIALLLPSIWFPFGFHLVSIPFKKSGIRIGHVVRLVHVASYWLNPVDSSGELIVTWRFVQFCILAYVSKNTALLCLSVGVPPSQHKSFQTSNIQTKIALAGTNVQNILAVIQILTTFFKILLFNFFNKVQLLVGKCHQNMGTMHQNFSVCFFFLC